MITVKLQCAVIACASHLLSVIILLLGPQSPIVILCLMCCLACCAEATAAGHNLATAVHRPIFPSLLVSLLPSHCHYNDLQMHWTATAISL